MGINGATLRHTLRRAGSVESGSGSEGAQLSGSALAVHRDDCDWRVRPEISPRHLVKGAPFNSFGSLLVAFGILWLPEAPFGSLLP